MKKIITLAAAIAAFAALAGPAAAHAKSEKSSAQDRNHDGLPDKWEKRHHLSLKVNQAQRDQDRDGLTNIGEFGSGTNPRDADSDNDGVSDAAEDRDGDGVDNANEVRSHTNPRSQDSDHDGVKDGQEDADHDGLSNADEQRLGDDPANHDSNHDGVDDGHEVNGAIVSFDSSSGLLTIRRPDNSTVSGTVNSSTAIECKTAEHRHGGSHPKHGADDAPSAGVPSGAPSNGTSSETGAVTPATSDDHGSASGSDSGTCTSADLQTDTLVHEAELVNGLFTKVEILK